MRPLDTFSNIHVRDKSPFEQMTARDKYLFMMNYCRKSKNGENGENDARNFLMKYLPAAFINLHFPAFSFNMIANVAVDR